MKKRFFITFFVALLIFSGIYTYVWGNFINKDREILKSDDGKKVEVSEGAEEKINEDNEVLFLMMGVDVPDAKNAKTTRTDTMMLIKANFDEGSLDLLSLPRDTRLPVNGNMDKLNHAHVYGGTPLTIKTLKEFMDIDLNYYVKVDYRAVSSIVDAIGGVDLYVPRRMEYHDTTAGQEFHVDLYEGQQTLDGNQAMQFLRWRKNNAQTRGYVDGDVGRIEAQQYFMTELMKQTLQAKNIIKLPQMVNTYFDYVDTNIPMSAVLKGVTMAGNMDMDKVNMQTLPGDGQYIGDVSYFVYDEIEAEKVISEMFGDYSYSRTGKSYTDKKRELELEKLENKEDQRNN